MSRNRSPLELLAVFLYLLIVSRIILGYETGQGVTKVFTREGHDAVLPCCLSTKENLRYKLFDWRKDERQKEVFMYDAGFHYNNGNKGQDPQFKGRVSFFPELLQDGNASIVIEKTTMEDGGIFECTFPRLTPKETHNIHLVIELSFRDRSAEITGTCPKPYVTTLAQTKTTAKLKCEVHRASPKPRLQWFDGAGNMLPAEELLVNETGGRYDIILQTTVTKTDRYRCVATQEEISHQPEPSETFVFISDVIMVNEDSDACLPCSPSPKENLVLKLFDWKKDGQKEVFIYNAGIHYNNGFKGQDEQFKGRVSHFPEELENSNASIKIKNVKMEDSGNYTCIFPHFKPVQKFHLMLVVHQNWRDRSSEIAGASPKPNISVLGSTDDGMELRCEVQGAFPKSKVEWKDSAGNILPAETILSETGGRHDIIIIITVTKTNLFSCVVTQEDISHQITAETYVFFKEKPCEDSVRRVRIEVCFALLVGQLLIFLVIFICLVCRNCITIKCNRANRRPEVKSSHFSPWFEGLWQKREDSTKHSINREFGIPIMHETKQQLCREESTSQPVLEVHMV